MWKTKRRVQSSSHFKRCTSVEQLSLSVSVVVPVVVCVFLLVKNILSTDMSKNSRNQRLGWDELVSTEYERLLAEKKLKNLRDLKQRSWGFYKFAFHRENLRKNSLISRNEILEALQTRPQQATDKRQWNNDAAPTSIELSAIVKLPPMKSYQFINRNVQGVARTVSSEILIGAWGY